ncbi:MAG: PLP-dependent cysteine synthase family protein [Flavobacteriia bacterium]|nr:PLP-dependent cysteine synthase family protein [Flavobacteriia bacterium]OJX37687.1 MAG: cysteine synthase [Flavobacteriia bacterium 40-80]
MIATLVNQELQQKLENIQQEIGNTPLIPIIGLHNNPDVKIYAKTEWEQLSGSVKARAAFHIIKNAIENEELTDNKILLDATSGNTGIAYAAIGKKLGIKVTLLLPENASKERKELLQSLGAAVIFTSKFGGTDEAQEIAAELAERHPNQYFYASQYTNENNWKAHYYGTAEEIFKELPEVDYFIAGLGTTGTFTGTSKRLKEVYKNIQTIALQPDFALHGLEGWKHLETAIVPQIYNPAIPDRIVEVSTERAYQVIEEFYEKSGLLLSPSSAANLAGTLSIAEAIPSGTIVTILPDNADKYSEVIKTIFKNDTYK